MILTPEEHALWPAIGRINVGGLDSRRICTGTLIAPDLVLTAAHCVPARAARVLAPEPVHFVAGWYRDDFVAHRTARQVILHPSRGAPCPSGFTFCADQALLVLDEPIPPEVATPLPLGELPAFADDLEIIAYSDFRQHALSRAGPCVAVPFADGAIRTTCEVSGGNSGAPVLRRVGDTWTLVAVVVAKGNGTGPFRSYALRPLRPLLELAP